MRKIKRRPISPEKATSVCAWCQKRIPPDTELFALGAKFKPGVDLKEGSVTQLFLATTGNKIYAIIPTSDSQAKKEGKDILFTICSHSCGMALKKALEQEIDLIDRVIQ